MGGISKPSTITSPALPKATAAPAPTVPTVATEADAANVQATNPDVVALLGRDPMQIRKRQDAYAQYLGANRNNLPTILGS